MSSSETISIVVVTDDHYVIMLAALIKSIEDNHKSNERLLFYVVDDGISKSNKERICNSVNSSMTTLDWVDIKNVIPLSISLPLDKTTFPLNIYARLFIPYFINKGTNKALFIDVDMLFQADISNLWKTDISQYPIAAVTDPRLKVVSNPWGGILNYKDLGLDSDTKYFNAGLYLLNIDLWKRLNISENVIKCISSNINYANYPDQYGLNVILANKWLELDYRWNYFASEHEDIKPFNIHFIGRKPIYSSYNQNLIFKDKFYHYLKMTSWSNFKPYSEISRYKKKINNVIEKKISDILRFSKK